MEAGRRAARGDDVMAMIDADLAFHKALYEAAGNPLIYDARLHWSHLRRVMGAVLQQSGQRDAVWDEHQAIADAIAAGDPRRAGLIEEHSRHASEVLGERLQQVLNRPPLPQETLMRLTQEQLDQFDREATCSSPACSRPGNKLMTDAVPDLYSRDALQRARERQRPCAPTSPRTWSASPSHGSRHRAWCSR